MTQREGITFKKNVSKFEEDVRKTGSYAYTSERLSSRYANARISEAIAQSYDFAGKKVLDLGCGDGTYTLEFPTFGAKVVVGIDPATAAIDTANSKARKLGLDTIVKFETGNIYALAPYLSGNRFDCIVLRGVLHHLPDPAQAISCLASFNGSIVVLEPNGNNPVLKVLEKFSRYHIDHEERSFSPGQICSWLTATGFRVYSSRLLNLVPMFSPDWIASIAHFVGPLVERLFLVRSIFCGQIVIVARK